MNVAIGVTLIIIAFLLIYSGFRSSSPMEEVRKAFGA